MKFKVNNFRFAGYLKSMLLLSFWLFVTLNLLPSGCSSPTGPSSSAPQLVLPRFSGPNVNSSDPYVMRVTSSPSIYNDFRNDMVSKFNYYSDGSQSSRTDTSWKCTKVDEFGNTYTWSVSQRQDTTFRGFTWKLEVNDNPLIWDYCPLWVWYDGWISFDNKSGSICCYDHPYAEGGAVKQMSWWTGSDGSLNGTFQEGDYVLGVQNHTYYGADQCSNYLDKSGAVNDSGRYGSRFRATWKANGSGEYWNYDSNGNLTAHGTW